VFELYEPQIIDQYLEVRSAGQKGRGVFTRVPDIPAPELLLQEQVLIHIPDSKREEDSTEARGTAVMRLSAEVRRTDFHGLPSSEDSQVI
jgi:hypothetical protein